MRRQYHFQPAADGDGLDAWDVHRLIELAADLPIVDIAVIDIDEVDTAYWSAPGDGPTTIRQIAEHLRYVRDVDTSYPILLGHDGRLMDGMHRVVRALIDGRETIAARRFPGPISPDHRNCHPSDLRYD